MSRAFSKNGIGRLESLALTHHTPDSIGRLEPLKDLWLDQNHMTALPWNFFQLTNLVALNMEVNPDMVHPTIKYVGWGWGGGA